MDLLSATAYLHETDGLELSTRGVLDLTRFRGHPKVRFGGVHDGRQIGPVHPGVQATNGRAGTHGAHPGVAGEGVRPHPLDDLSVGQAKTPATAAGAMAA